MDNNMNRYYDDEREIDLIDILGRIIAKWRTILIATLVGLVIGLVIASIMGFVNMQNSNTEAQKLSAQKAEALALEKLLQDEKGDELQEVADNNLVKYINIKSLYDMQNEYNQQSIYKNMDATRLAKAHLTYYIDNHYVSEYPVVDTYNNIEDVMDAYRSALLSDEVLNEIISELGIDTEPKYIRELISVENPTTGNLAISIMSGDEAMTQAISLCMQKAVEDVTDYGMADYGDITASLQEEQMYVESDFDVMATQNEADAKLTDYYNQLQTISNSMSGAQGDYFDAILAKHNLEVVKKESVQHGFFYYLSKKLIVIVAVAFAFLAIVVYGVIYLFDGCVKTASELATLSHSMLLGTVLVDGEKKSKKVLFDKWAVALTDKKAMCEDSDRMIHVIATSVNQFLKANGYSKVLFVGADVKNTAVLDAIASDVCSAGNTADVALDAFDSPETVDSLAAADAVIFVGEVARSKYSKLERVLSMCNLYKKQIMGTVAVQERI